MSRKPAHGGRERDHRKSHRRKGIAPMKKFTTIESRVVPLPIDNIDTDQIIPARFLKTISKEGLDRNLFCDWRYDAQGNPNPDFILNQPRALGAELLLA